MFEIKKLPNQEKVKDCVYFDVFKSEEFIDKEFVGRVYIDLKEKSLNYSYPIIPYCLDLSKLLNQTLNDYHLEEKEYKCVI